AATRPWLLRLFAAVFTDLLIELFDASLTKLFAALLPEFLDAVFTELFLDDLAATVLPRDPPLLTRSELEKALAAATFGLGVGDLAVLGLAGIGGAPVTPLAWLSTDVIIGLCTAASDSPLLVDLDSGSPTAASAPPVLGTRTFGAFSAGNKFRLNSAVEVGSA